MAESALAIPPIRGHTSSAPRHGLRGVGCLKQLPKPVFQQFDGLPQGAELSNPQTTGADGGQGLVGELVSYATRGSEFVAVGG